MIPGVKEATPFLMATLFRLNTLPFKLTPFAPMSILTAFSASSIRFLANTKKPLSFTSMPFHVVVNANNRELNNLNSPPEIISILTCNISNSQFININGTIVCEKINGKGFSVGNLKNKVHWIDEWQNHATQPAERELPHNRLDVVRPRVSSQHPPDFLTDVSNGRSRVHTVPKKNPGYRPSISERIRNWCQEEISFSMNKISMFGLVFGLITNNTI